MGPGRRIGAYEVVRELGRGGMGVVYEVRHPALPRRLALKLVTTGGPLGAASDTALARFEREARLLARVRHPNVLGVHALETSAPEGPFLVTELVEGSPLDRLTAERKGGRPLEPTRAAALLHALADGLAAVHGHGILHRDLKPANVMVRPDGSPVLLDFGLARDVDAERLTQSGALLGTPAFMAPEQAAGGSPGDLDARVDVYGLGALLYACVTGRPPFAAESSASLIYKVLTQVPVWPPELEADAPGLVAIGRKAMARAREARYPDAGALRDDLARLLAGEPPLALLSAEERAATAAARARRARAVSLVVGLGVALCLVVMVARQAGLRARAREALEAARRYDQGVLEPWGLGLGALDVPDAAEVDEHLAALEPCASALDGDEAAAAATQLERLRAARHVLTATRPPAGPRGDARSWVAVAVDALGREDLRAAEEAAEAAAALQPRGAPVAWLRLALAARRDPLGQLRLVADSETTDPRRGARAILAAALDAAYPAALAAAIEKDPTALSDLVEVAQDLGLDLGRARAAKAELLGAEGRVRAWEAALAQPPGLETDRALDALERLALVHTTPPAVEPSPALVEVLRRRLAILAEDAAAILRPQLEVSAAERQRTLLRLLRFEAACAWPLRVDTRLEVVQEAVRQLSVNADASFSVEVFTRNAITSLRVGGRQTVVFGTRVEAYDAATLAAVERSGDPLAALHRRFGVLPFDHAGFEAALREVPEAALAPRHRGELLVLAADRLLRHDEAGEPAARAARIVALATEGRALLGEHPVATARSYEVEAAALATLRGDEAAAVALMRAAEVRLTPGPDARPDDLEAHARICMWLAWTEHLASPFSRPPLERARAVVASAASDKVSRDARLVLSRMLRRQGRGEDALRALEPITDEDRRDPSLWIAEAIALELAGRRERAAEVLADATRRFGNHPAFQPSLDEARREARLR